MSLFSFEAWLASQSQRAECALLQYLDSDTAIPQHLHAAMRYAVLGGGKRIRPLLVFAASELGSVDQVDGSLVNRAASAIEMIHTYSLVHDDLPCMDDDDLRRGRPTVHKAYDEATALLVGDALQTRAFEILSYPVGPDPKTGFAQLRMIASLAHASGSKGMAGGQAIDLQNVGKKMDLPALEEMHAMKTGALLICAVQLGGIAAQLSDPAMAQLDTYAKAIGLAFQVVDDILDATSDSATLGKTAGKDAAQDKPTYVTLKGLDYANELANELKGRALNSLNEFGPQADALRHIAHLVVDRKK
ncbi:polyprenyl synthetase family protein [Polynucleobacter sp. HIN6]|uniref:polyprenyl synthetase family protein n=1 Tax=Polynucleobacter sp. HIN6 TaxID=3047865 RepID=UPI0025732E9C|nr:farnesyl diphosphate synthase [Polynucleobacter sp. HIN6]